MEVISKHNITVLNLLSKFYQSFGTGRFSKYCVISSCDEGYLVYNTLTRELVLLSEAEYKNYIDNVYLKSHWFVVPDRLNEKQLADLTKSVLMNSRGKLDCISSYTIFPTTDCNARCFYCFELGRSRTPMSTDTALKSVEYIKNHCGGQKVKIRWFGGEPLLNQEAIDIISTGLSDSSIEFSSVMITNGYLFDQNSINKAKSLWNLEKVQISLDGTEKNYNKIKAYVYKNVNPYEVVLNNIENLLLASIKVTIRLNMDLYNAEDLINLVDYLGARFSGCTGLTIYAHHLFKDGVPMGEMYSEDEWEHREKYMDAIENRIIQYGFGKKAGISSKISPYHCMADCGHAITILPSGNIGLCEHYSESEFIGHLDNDHFDKSLVDSWRELIAEIPDCEDCFYYPMCIRLKRCKNSSICYPQYRSSNLKHTISKMHMQYQKWRESSPV